MGFIGRFDVAAHASSSFRSFPKPERPFLWALVWPRSGSMHDETVRSHTSCAGTVVCTFDPEAMAARACASRLPNPRGNSDHLFGWRGQFAVAPSSHTLSGPLTMLRTHRAEHTLCDRPVPSVINSMNWPTSPRFLEATGNCAGNRTSNVGESESEA